MGHIFISYSRKDEEYVNKLVVALENEGFEVWIDRELLTGDTWTQVINHKIDTCDAFVIVMTDSSKESNWVRREVLYAIQEGKKIFPLLLQGKLWMLLQDFNFFKVTDGLIPDRKFFKDIERSVPRSEAWLTAQREAAEKAVREKAEKEAAEKAWLETEELARQKTAKGKAEREATEHAEKERKAKELREKQAREAKEKEKRESEKKEEKPVAVKPKSGGQIAYWFGGFIVLVLGIIFLSSLSNPPSTPQSTPENTQTPTIATLSEDSVVPSATTAPESTLTYSETQTPLPTEITDAKGVAMMLVPEGVFTMGDSGRIYGKEWPIHNVYLDAYYIDKYEVTNSHYKTCVDAKVCDPPKETNSHTDISYYGNPKYDDNPVIYVDWTMSKTFCEWRDTRLPTEAEWEKAARGVDGYMYPWGEDIDSTGANVGNTDTVPVGSYKKDKSPYGVYDMAGNVLEWVADFFSYSYYQNSPSSNPLSAFGEGRSVRGGSWSDYFYSYKLRTFNRNWVDPANAYNNLGFRCARSDP